MLYRLLMFVLIAFIFLPGVNAQSYPVRTDSTFFYADSISGTITLGKNEFLAMVWVDASRSATLNVQFYDASKAQWSWLQDSDVNWVATMDSSDNCAIALEPWLFYAAKSLRFLIDNDPADTLSMRYDTRPY